MITLRQTVYSLVAAGSLLMAGVQALGSSDEEVVEESVIGLGQARLEPVGPQAGTPFAEVEARAAG
ncbi:MAG: hypothetical protein M3Z16_11960 [Pseudomonadota bacterium]|nr:hypothetical protein [Pseudomonadota bacterium]